MWAGLSKQESAKYSEKAGYTAAKLQDEKCDLRQCLNAVVQSVFKSITVQAECEKLPTRKTNKVNSFYTIII